MFRGLLIVLMTLAVLIASVTAVVGIGLRRLAAAQKQADESWQRPQTIAISATKPVDPSDSAVTAADEQDPPPVVDTIDLLAKDANRHGAANLVNGAQGRGRTDPPKDPRLLARWQKGARMGGRPNMTYITGFDSDDDFVDWQLTVPKAGDYEIDLTYACPAVHAGGEFIVTVGDKELPLSTEATRNEVSFHVVPIGKATLPAGNFTLAVHGKRASLKSHCFMNLRSVEIIPVPAGAAAP